MKIRSSRVLAGSQLGWTGFVVATVAMATLALLGTEAAAKPRKVFLNGEDLGDVVVQNHTFKGCIVRFDSQGNVHITAPNLEIKTQPIRSARGKVPVAATLGGVGSAVSKVAKAGSTFFLVSRPVNQGNLVPYRFKVFVNGKRVAIVDPGGLMAVHNVTHLIQKGTNTVRVEPAFQESQKITRSPRDRFVIVLGSGAIKQGTVVIDNPVVTYERSGAETGQFTKVFRFGVR